MLVIENVVIALCEEIKYADEYKGRNCAETMHAAKNLRLV